MTSPSGPAAVGQDPVDGAGLNTGEADARLAAVGLDSAGPGTSSQAGRSQAGPGAVAGGPRAFDPGPLWMRVVPSLVTIAITLWGITVPSFWRDEAATLAAVQRPFGDLLKMLGNVDAVHSLYYMTMWVVVRVAGTGELALRLPSAIALAIGAGVVAAIGRRLISPQAGLASGLIFAVLPAVSYYSQDARPYAMVITMAAVTSYVLLRLLDAQPVARRRWLIWYAVSAAGLGVVNIFGLLLIPAHAITVGLAYLRSSDDSSRTRLVLGWLTAVVAAVIVTVPLLWLGWQQRGQISWITVSKAGSNLTTLLTVIGSMTITVMLVGVIGISAVVSAQSGKAHWLRSWPTRLGDLSLPWLVMPPAILLLASAVITPMYTPRYVLLCIPAWALLGGAAVAVLGRVYGPLALAVVLVAGLPAQLGERGPAGHADNIRALDKVVAADARPGDALLYVNPNSESFGAAYPTGLSQLTNVGITAPAISSGTLGGQPATTTQQVRSRLHNVNRLWVVEIAKPPNGIANPDLLQISSVPVTAGNKTSPPVLTGLPFVEARHWKFGSDYLVLFVRD